MKRYYTVLTIAGSDSGGGAGIQADIKAISACGCYAMSAITAITAQNTVGVTDIHPVPTPILAAQIRAVLEDIGADAIKIGMLHSREVIECIVSMIDEFGVSNIVLDPVMVATSGDRLIQEEAISAMQDMLFPKVRLITPNIPEAEILLSGPITDTEQVEKAARELGKKYNVSVLAKAGHLESSTLEDTLYNHETGDVSRFVNTRVDTPNTHGTGCTLSSALASYLARGLTIDNAADQAIRYVAGSIRSGSQYGIGKGHGPVHHFHEFWN